ncbi:MAG: polysaccharide deacetylase family protein [Thermoplasmata archaeon]|nr:MAG: polysaccharide deacetylase family protein [Thermoplasmata archaeon]
MGSKKVVAIILCIILIIVSVNLGIYIINEYYIDSDINYHENQAIEQGHELGSHGARHVKTKDFSYDEALTWTKESLALIEDNTKSTSRWGTTCLSIAYPYSSPNKNVMKAAYDTGFRIAGNCFFDSICGLIINETSAPEDEMDWMNIARLGGKVTEGEAHISDLHKAEQNGSWADCMFHQNDKLDSESLKYIDSNNNVWYATWGEVRSYYYIVDHTTVYFNSQNSNDTKMVFELDYTGSDPKIWDVPITLEFDLEQFNFDNLSVKYRSNNSHYQHVENISNDQRMEEGYKYDPETKVLYVSIKPKNKSITIIGNILSDGRESDMFMGFSRWWNGLTWVVTIHVDDVRDVSEVLINYQDHKQPLTLMIMGMKWDMAVLYIITIISIFIMIPLIVVLIREFRKNKG